MFKDRPLLSAFCIFVMIAVSGTILGVAWGILEANSVGQKLAAEDPQNPRDMLHMVALTYAVLGFIGGMLYGLLVAVIVYLTKRNEIADRKFSEQGIES